MKAKVKDTPIELLLTIIAAVCLALALNSCVVKRGTLPNGCKYKIIAPKFRA